MKTLFTIIAVISLACLAFSIPISIGYGLYLWGPGAVELSMAAWSAFKLWLFLVIVGLPAFTFSSVAARHSK